MDAGQLGEDVDSAAPGERVAVLDDALWARFDDARDVESFSRIWLTLQVRQLGHVAAAAVLMDRGDSDFAPVARWPLEGALDQRLVDAVEAAIERDTQAVSGGRAVAHPLHVDGALIGAVGFLMEPGADDLTAVLRQLRWGSGWLLEVARGTLMQRAETQRSRMASTLDLVGAVLDARTFDSACLAAVNLLARETGSEQVGLGLQRGGRVRLCALSDVADFRMNTSHGRAIEQAMAESADQSGSGVYPPRPDQGFMVDRAHAELHGSGQCGELLSVPLVTDAAVLGALHFRKPAARDFSVADVMSAEAAAAVLAPLLTDKRLLDRSPARVLLQSLTASATRLLGPGYLGRKLAALTIVALAACLVFIHGDYRVKAQSEVQGRVIRSVGAPFDGNIAEQFFRAGDAVTAGAVLAQLDVRDLRLELLRAETDIARLQGEYDRALAARDAPEARVVDASIAEAEARAKLLTAQIERAALTVPFDSIVISGDLSQSLGAAVRRGEELFQIAPLQSYRVVLEVDEAQLDEIRVEQEGALALASLPAERFRVRVNQVTPSLEARDGRNVALVEAEILDSGPQVRPGMRGVAKIEVDRRPLIEIWARPIIDWFRLALWRWTP